MSLIASDITSLRAKLADKQFSAREVVQCYLERIERLNPRLNAVREVCTEKALSRADEVDTGRVTGRLAGIPILAKDNMCVNGVSTCAGSEMLGSFQPPYTASAIEKLEAEGAIILGMTQMDEFAMGSSCETCAFGTPTNPWDTAYVPGGSSGGGASAMAAHLASGCLGSDTGGSIRQPAAYCGVVGLKPTYGRISRYGLIAFASSLDQIGPMTTSVADAALLLQVMSGADPRDATSARVDVEEDLHLVDLPAIEGRAPRIGIDRNQWTAQSNNPQVIAALDRALENYRQQGVEIVDIQLPHSKYAIACYYLVATAEASSNLSRYTGMLYGKRTAEGGLMDSFCASRGAGFGSEVKRRIMLGTYALSRGYEKGTYTRALQARRLIRNDYDIAFSKCDAILSPTTASPAFKLGEKSNDPLAMYQNDLYTVSANLAGLPAISLPAGLSDTGLPIGIQLTGPAFHERSLLRLARLHEQMSPSQTPPPSCL